MATKEQYDFFKDQYLDEEKRYSDLTKRAEIYFVILSILLSGIVFKLKELFDLYTEPDLSNRLSVFALFILSFGLFGVGFYFITQALRVKNFQAVIDFKEYRDSLGDMPPTNEEFFDDRIIDYMYATEQNELVNDDRANALTKALQFILFGFISIFLFITTVLIQKI